MKAVFDTNIARKLGHPGDDDYSEVLRGLRALKCAGFSLHLTDGTAMELLRQIQEEKFAWPDWVRARRLLSSLLCNAEPILFGGRELLADVGIHDPQESAKIPIGLREVLRALWKALARAQSPGEISKPRPTRVNGKRVLVGREFREAAKIVQREQDLWVQTFTGLYDEATRMDVTSRSAVEPEAILKLFSESYDKKVTVINGPRASTRLDAMFRVYVHFFRLRIGRQPYNPENRVNDALDCELLRFLAVPAVICTCDKRTLMTAVKESGSWQRRWLLGPTELLSLAQGGSLPDLSWPE